MSIVRMRIADIFRAMQRFAFLLYISYHILGTTYESILVKMEKSFDNLTKNLALAYFFYFPSAFNPLKGVTAM